MATIPCTLLLKSNDLMNLPIDTLLILCKQLFKYGVKSMQLRKDQILVQLIYTPKGETLRRKMGNLPVSCVRLVIEKEEELDKLEEAMKRFRFNLLETGEEEVIRMIEQDPGPSSSKRKMIEPNPGPSTSVKRKASPGEEIPATRKIKILEDRMVKQKTVAPELNEDNDVLILNDIELMEEFDEDAELFNSQKFSVKVKEKKHPINVIEEDGGNPFTTTTSNFINID